MSQENVEIVRRGFEAFASGDVAAMLARIDDDLVTRRLAPMPDPGTWHGREGFLDVFVEWTEAFDEFTAKAEELIDAGDHVVARVTQEGRGAGSGVPVTATFWFVYSTRDGKIVTWDMYSTRSQAFAAVGLEE
jgi:hypothetical protein